MKILFLGAQTGTSGHRVGAMRRLGHQVRVLNPAGFVPAGRMNARLHYETGGLLCRGLVGKRVMAGIGADPFDLIWVDSGRYVGPELIHTLRQRYGPAVGYNHDDPYGRRDRFSWQLFLRAVPAYDLVVVVREPNVSEALALGAKRVRRVSFAADEVAHARRDITSEDRARWQSDVVFVGTGMPERGPFMAELVRRGVPLSIYGNSWQKRREWPVLRSVWKGPGTVTDDDYAKAIQCAKICLGLVSRGNRDRHTTRSVEIPALGGLLCAIRTTDHQEMYTENEEAVLWSDAAECAEVCRALLGDETGRLEIARRGRQRLQRNDHLNEPILSGILEAAFCAPDRD